MVHKATYPSRMDGFRSHVSFISSRFSSVSPFPIHYRKSFPTHFVASRRFSCHRRRRRHLATSNRNRKRAGWQLGVHFFSHQQVYADVKSSSSLVGRFGNSDLESACVRPLDSTFGSALWDSRVRSWRFHLLHSLWGTETFFLRRDGMPAVCHLTNNICKTHENVKFVHGFQAKLIQFIRERSDYIKTTCSKSLWP